LRCGLLGQGCLGRPNLLQCRFPAAFQFRRDETVVRIDAVELPFRQGRSVAGAFDLPFCVCKQRRVDLALGPPGARQGIQFGRRQRGQERIGHGGIHARRPDVLTDGQARVGAQVIADILATPLVADIHLVTTARAPGDAVQQEFAIAGSAARLGAHVFGPVVAHDAADLLIAWPIDVGRIFVLYDDAPFIGKRRSNPTFLLNL